MISGIRRRPAASGQMKDFRDGRHLLVGNPAWSTFEEIRHLALPSLVDVGYCHARERLFEIGRFEVADPQTSPKGRGFTALLGKSRAGWFRKQYCRRDSEAE